MTKTFWITRDKTHTTFNGEKIISDHELHSKEPKTLLSDQGVYDSRYYVSCFCSSQWKRLTGLNIRPGEKREIEISFKFKGDK